VPRRPFAEFRASVNAEPEGPSMGLRSHASRARGTTCLPGPADPDLGSGGSSSESLQLDALDAALRNRLSSGLEADHFTSLMSWGDRTGPRRAPSSRGVPGTPAEWSVRACVLDTANLRAQDRETSRSIRGCLYPGHGKRRS
jgi:hypothetical protein